MTPEQWKRARLVLEGAKRHSPEDRSQYISIACADDPELQREVESLLYLSSTPSPGSGAVTDRTGPTLTQWEHLTVLAEVGRGAFGRVYRAWDPALQTEVALKLIRVDTREAEFAESVFHEARLLVKVRHPNVVTVLGARRVGSDVGIWMEFVNGPTLADAIERDGPMGPLEAAAAGIAICDALAAVHGSGLLHRDIKARNVMRDASGRIVLMDFGAGADRRYLPSGELAGTPLYMAPEVLKGAGASVASDVYSVGVLLFHLVTGEYPVKGGNIYELEAAHEQRARTALGERRPDLPPSFLAAVERALAADPDARFRRAVEFRDALADATTRIAVPAAASAAAPVDRWPWIAALSIGGALVVLTFLGFVTSAALNVLLERDARFVDESPLEWPIWGMRAILGPVIYMGVMLILAILFRWVSGWMATAVRRLTRRPRTIHAAPAWRIDPNVPARVGAMVGVAALILIGWQFGGLLAAVMSKISLAARAEFAPLAPDNGLERVLYRRSLEATMLIVGFGLYQALRLRREFGGRLDASAIVSSVAVLLVAVLLTVAPYRIFYQVFPRTTFDGMRCYVIGRSGSEMQLYCPDFAGPHPRTLSADEAKRVASEGVDESIFTPPSQAARPQQQ